MNKKAYIFIFFLSFFHSGVKAQIGRGAQIPKSKSFEMKTPASFPSQGTVGKKNTFESIKQWFTSKRPMSTSKSGFKPVSSKTPLMKTSFQDSSLAFKQPVSRRSFFSYVKNMFSGNRVIDLQLPAAPAYFSIAMANFSLMDQFKIREMIAFVKIGTEENVGVYSQYQNDALWKRFAKIYSNNYKGLKDNRDERIVTVVPNAQRFFHALDTMDSHEKAFLKKNVRICTTYDNGYYNVSREFINTIQWGKSGKNSDDLHKMTKEQPNIPWVYTLDEYEEEFKPRMYMALQGLEIYVVISPGLVNASEWLSFRKAVDLGFGKKSEDYKHQKRHSAYEGEEKPSAYEVVNKFRSFLKTTADKKVRQKKYYDLMKEYHPDKTKGDKKKEAIAQEINDTYDSYNVD